MSPVAASHENWVRCIPGGGAANRIGTPFCRAESGQIGTLLFKGGANLKRDPS
jgi:hypothetical protein